MRSQCPVQTQTVTKAVDSASDSSSAGVKRPQQPNDTLATDINSELRYTSRRKERRSNKINLLSGELASFTSTFFYTIDVIYRCYLNFY